MLQISSQRLLSLDCFKERLKVPFSKTTSSLALNHFKEDRRAVDDRLGEDLQQVALIVVIDQDTEFCQLLQVLIDLANAIQHILIIRVWRFQEFDATVLQ